MSLAAWIGLAVAGGLGAGGRYLLELAVAGPLGTALVNLSGATAIGLLAGLGVRGAGLFVLGTGLLGGYTTFSGWMREVRDDARPAVVLLAPLALGLLCVWAGRLLGQAL